MTKEKKNLDLSEAAVLLPSDFSFFFPGSKGVMLLHFLVLGIKHGTLILFLLASLYHFSFYENRELDSS